MILWCLRLVTGYWSSQPCCEAGNGLSIMSLGYDMWKPNFVQHMQEGKPSKRTWSAWTNKENLSGLWYKKLRYREEHSASVVHSWFTLWHFLGENLSMANQPLSRNGPENYWIRRTNGHYTVHCHSVSLISVSIEIECDFLLVINTNFPHRLQVMADN